ncbi:hypothetical protein [Bacillus swezeyi]|uniref:hypothetical protein n=1 Tax=Bacillus swezeyi TaxID=1925020 RepID=UPI00123919B9|nr:hypothetical protein [Bacillus swezeyi]KAA6473719.1 hypothetical protein DX928_20555 [Bacillus swezeyi]
MSKLKDAIKTKGKYAVTADISIAVFFITAGGIFDGLFGAMQGFMIYMLVCMLIGTFSSSNPFGNQKNNHTPSIWVRLLFPSNNMMESQNQ